MYVLRTLITPALGKGPEVRQLLEEWVQDRQTKGQSFMLTRQVLGPEGASFVITGRYPDLAAYEQQLQALAQDRTHLSALAKVTERLRGPMRQELFEILVPFPA